MSDLGQGYPGAVVAWKITVGGKASDGCSGIQDRANHKLQ